MRTISSERKRLVVELTSDDWRKIGALFDVISADNGAPVPWWGSEEGDGTTVLDNDKFNQLFKDWNNLTKCPEAKAFFTGEK